MLAHIADNALTIIVIGIILLLVGIAIFTLVRDKKKHKDACTGNCASCGVGCPYCKH